MDLLTLNFQPWDELCERIWANFNILKHISCYKKQSINPSCWEAIHQMWKEQDREKKEKKIDRRKKGGNKEKEKEEKKEESRSEEIKTKEKNKKKKERRKKEKSEMKKRNKFFFCYNHMRVFKIEYRNNLYKGVRGHS